MEFRLITTEQELSRPIVWNTSEIKEYVSGVVENFKTLEYSEEQEAEAKKDRSQLNKLREALKKAKKNVKQQNDIPYEKFAEEMDATIKMLDETIEHIDKQTAEMDNKRRQENLEKAKQLYDLTIGGAGYEDWLPWGYVLMLKASARATYEDVFGNKGSWTASEDLATSGKKIIDIFEKLIANVEKSINTVKAMHSKFEEEALEVLRETKSTEMAMAEIARLTDIEERSRKMAEEATKRAEEDARRRIEEERIKAEERQRRAVEEAEKRAREEVKSQYSFNVECPVDEPRQEAEIIHRQEEQERQWVAFKAYMNIAQAIELKKFFSDRGIEFGPVQESRKATD